MSGECLERSLFNCIQFDEPYLFIRAGACRRAMPKHRARCATQPVDGYGSPPLLFLWEGRYFPFAGRRCLPIVQKAGFALAGKATARAPPSQRTGNSGQMDTIKQGTL